jgi:glycosyltransferase involved in cell wall biosynthesis
MAFFADRLIIICMTRICIVPEAAGVGGMASFRRKFEAGLSRRGISVTHDAREASDAILVIAGTKNLLPLWRRRRKRRIVQRLDGINWIQRRRNTGLRHRVRAEYGNLILALIRSRIATHIVYQSEFCHRWWEEWYGRVRAGTSVVHNGADLEEFHPAEGGMTGTGGTPAGALLNDAKGGRCRLLVVEGSLEGGYDMGLDNAVRLAETLAGKYGFPMELMAAGKISEEHKARVERSTHIPMLWAGVLPPKDVVTAMHQAQLLYSADLNPACPNSVIEAMACGLPVAAFDTGAIRELVSEAAGAVVPYGGDPWKVEPPDIAALAEGAAEVLRHQPIFRAGARAEAEAHLGLDAMIDGYLKALLEG